MSAGRPLAYFNEKLEGVYGLRSAIHNSHESLKHIKEQGKLNKGHVK